MTGGGARWTGPEVRRWVGGWWVVDPFAGCNLLPGPQAAIGARTNWGAGVTPPQQLLARSNYFVGVLHNGDYA